MIKTIVNQKLNGAENKPIWFDIAFDESISNKPIIIFVHGFKGFKDWGHFNLMMQFFAEKGFCFLKFNFSHGGIVAPYFTEISDLDVFGNNNFSIELDELKIVLDYISQKEKTAHFGINTNQIILIGHSRGGGICMLKAAEDKRIKKLISWAGVMDLSRFWNNKLVEQWKIDGVQYAINSRTGQKLPIYFQLYENYYMNEQRLNIPSKVKEIAIPFLHIHGTADETVPASWAYEIKELNQKVELQIIDDANHIFGSKHPYSEKFWSGHLKTLLENTLKFLNK